MRDKTGNLLAWAIASGVLVAADQYTKLLASAHLKGKPTYVLLEGVFELLYSENRGAAFGMMQGKQGFFLIITMLVLGAAAYAMWKMPSWRYTRYHWLKVCVILVTAGAVGNMIDRISQGYVVDFLYFSLIDFPIFNVADIYVTTAAAALILLLMVYYKEDELEIFQLHRKGEER